ncbi:hypothetical protein [Escherichia coli]|uniref:hypothetical protein n=1 Tax=Escherichia coli TaxID=562 RepID=UPI0039B6FCE5
MADYHPCEQKQRGGEFRASHNAKIFYSFLGYSGTMKVTPDRITDYKAPSAEEAAVASQAAKRPPVVNYPGKVLREMTKAQWAALPRGCKAVRSVKRQKTTGHTATAAQWTIVSAQRMCISPT